MTDPFREAAFGLAIVTLHLGLVHSHFPPGVPIGGIVRYVVAQARGFRDLGHRVTVIARDDENPRIEEWEEIEVHRVAVPSGGFLRNRSWVSLFDGLQASAAFARRVREIHRTSPLDVVEFTNYCAEGLVHSLRPSVPTVTRISTMGWQAREVNQLTGFHPGEWWRSWLEKVAIRRSCALVTSTELHAAEVRRECGRTLKIQIACLGSQISASRAIRHGNRSESGPVHFLFLGRLDPRKGFDVTMKAFAKVFDRLGAAVKMTVVGRDSNLGPGSSSFKAYALQDIRAEVLAKVHFAGGVPDAEIGGYYGAADVLVAPSRYESLGLMFLEAMEFGLPAIGCLAGGIPEVVQDGKTGILVLPGDADALAAAMMRLATNRQLREEMGAAGHALWEAEYTEKKMCERMLAIYGEVAGVKQ